MNKSLNIWVLMAIFSLSTLIFLTANYFVVEDEYYKAGSFGHYPDGGYSTFNPETILGALHQGETDVFTPFLGDIDGLDEHDGQITWSQSDYLKVTSALSQSIWGEPLDLENWKVRSVYFSQACKDNPIGFNMFEMVYYRPLAAGYTARYINIEPWRGLVTWAGNGIFSSPILSRWNNINLEGFVISADDVLQIAEKHGGSETDKGAGVCSTISVSMFRQDNDIWDVDYSEADFRIRIDPTSGEYKILNPAQ